MRILVIEHDFVAYQQLCRVWRGEDINHELADTLEDGIELLRHYDFDMVLVGSQPRDINIAALVRRLWGTAITTPLLALIHPVPGEVPNVLNAGADDVMLMPYSDRELIARLHAVLRRVRGFSHQVLRVGPLAIDVENHSVLVNDRPVALTGKEFQVLMLMALRNTRVVTKATFLDHLYGSADAEPDLKIIDVFICKLRKKLADAGSGDIISTVWGQGYRLDTTAAPAEPVVTRPVPPSRRAQRMQLAVLAA